MSEFISKGTKLSVAAIPQTGNTYTYKKIFGIYSVPDIGASPEMLDVTNLEDSVKRSIPGLGDVSALEFEMYAAENETDTGEQIRDTWNILRAYETGGDDYKWKLEYPDGEGYTWTGKCKIAHLAVKVNEPVKYKLTVSVGDDFTDI